MGKEMHCFEIKLGGKTRILESDKNKFRYFGTFMLGDMKRVGCSIKLEIETSENGAARASDAASEASFFSRHATSDQWWAIDPFQKKRVNLDTRLRGVESHIEFVFHARLWSLPKIQCKTMSNSFCLEITLKVIPTSMHSSAQRLHFMRCLSRRMIEP